MQEQEPNYFFFSSTSYILHGKFKVDIYASKETISVFLIQLIYRNFRSLSKIIASSWSHFLDSTRLGTYQGPDTLTVFVRNSEGCEDTHQPGRVGYHCWGAFSERHNYPKNSRHLCRSEQSQESWSLLGDLSRIPTQERLYLRLWTSSCFFQVEFRVLV